MFFFYVNMFFFHVGLWKKFTYFFCSMVMAPAESNMKCVLINLVIILSLNCFHLVKILGLNILKWNYEYNVAFKHYVGIQTRDSCVWLCSWCLVLFTVVEVQD